MAPYTPQEQAENMMKGIKNTYQVVAKRHVHPWYSWALMAVAIGFTIGVAYVANQNAQFDSSQAAEQIRTQTQSQQRVALSGRESGLALFKALVTDFKEEHGGQLPSTIKVIPGTLITSKWHNLDRVKLSTPATRILPFRTPAEQTEAYRYVSTISSRPFDVFFSSTPSANGFLVMPSGIPVNELTTSALEEGVKKSGVIITEIKCTCDLDGTVAYNGKKTGFDIRASKFGYDCDNDATCKTKCLGAAAGTGISILAPTLVPPPPPIDSLKHIMEASKSGDNSKLTQAEAAFAKALEAYLAAAEVTLNLSNRSTCNNSTVVSDTTKPAPAPTPTPAPSPAAGGATLPPQPSTPPVDQSPSQKSLETI